MQDRDYTVKTVGRNEIDIAIEWAADEGWNPGLHDADCYYSADQNGFLMGFLGDEPIASISVIRYSDAFGFLGFYIVKPGYRGKGYGIQLWNAGLKYLEGVNIGLDGVVAQQENYTKSGFKLAYRNIRYEGVGGGTQPKNAEIVELDTLPFESIDQYDRPFFPASRSQFTRSWITQPGSHALGILQNGQLAGYGVIRKCRNGYKIGPLYADNPELAESLFLALKSTTTSSDTVFLDTPDSNPAAVALAEKHHMSASFETARMYTGDFPEMPIQRLFGVTSFEIG
ncbi:Acetyltransferase (GNAT) domain-containing protein [Amphritea atlantica]|uniref:Acetyltransferase (GNAT) domain-containing protein n=1 Tax=Amphritea atlantica TaxID=355243 RepID=A0A1H9KU80_9GAMM|nr:GNAT family N-acetyltransferase [Amphritea atlantica]SER02353.1 Acetyltransferase (GNAT) domain-containing protein [Amphritea atlantica]